MERKSPLPAFTKCVKNNVLPLREDRNLGFRGGVKNKTLTSSTIHQLNMKGGGTQHRRVLIKNSPLLPPVLDYSGCPKTQRFRTPYELTPYQKAAFTLAEVLITLGIIGIVAAMTMPALIQKNNNRVVETRLMKFYSAMNQAIKLAEVDYGDRSYWFQDLYGVDDDGNSKIQPWIEKYFVPYLKVIKTDVNAEGRVTLYFADGTAMRSAIANGRDWIFFVGDPERCEKIGKGNYYNYIGRCAFAFYYNPTDGNKHTQGWHFEPYAAGWDGTEESLKSHPSFGCITKNPSTDNWHSYCTKWIQYNGWKIPDEYPYKVYYK